MSLPLGLSWSLYATCDYARAFASLGKNSGTTLWTTAVENTRTQSVCSQAGRAEADVGLIALLDT